MPGEILCLLGIVHLAVGHTVCRLLSGEGLVYTPQSTLKARVLVQDTLRMRGPYELLFNSVLLLFCTSLDSSMDVMLQTYPCFKCMGDTRGYDAIL
jgi:hypothetical protein